MKRKFLIPIIILGFVFLFSGYAMAYTIDGDLSDWGVNPSIPDWVPNPGIYYTEEDYVGPGGFVGPGWGGQQFDAEAMYLTYDNTNLYLALVTGFPDTGVYMPEGSGYWISAGDIAIDFGQDGIYEYGIEIGGHAPEYWGYNGIPGHAYTGVTWATSPSFPESGPLNIANTGSPMDKGSGLFVYSHSYPNTNSDYDHWVIELSIPRSAFGTDWNTEMIAHWTMTCGNDIVTAATPEPTSMALFGLGALGALLRKRGKKWFSTGRA